MSSSDQHGQDGNEKVRLQNEKLRLLREVMSKRGVSAYLVETQDAHQSEYVADHDKRREWLTDFTGSAGTALVTSTKALMWTDGRYFLQVQEGSIDVWGLEAECFHTEALITNHLCSIYGRTQIHAH